MSTLCLTRVDWLEIDQDPLPQPLKTCIAGAGYVPDIKERVKALGIGGPLILQREPWNPYDTYAIVVLSPTGQKLGYIPRSQNQALARSMDQGKSLRAVLTALSAVHSGWPQIYLKVYGN